MQIFLKLRACPKCKGALAFDPDEWVCVNCGERKYPFPPAADLDSHDGRSKKRDATHIRLMGKKHFREDEILALKDNGLSHKQVGTIIGRSGRYVRKVIEDMRDEGLI